MKKIIKRCSRCYNNDGEFLSSLINVRRMFLLHSMKLFSNLRFWSNINIATGVIESREGAESNFYFVDKIRAIKVGRTNLFYSED